MTEIRSAVPAALFVDQTWMPGITAGEYFAAVDSLGSTAAKSVATLRREPEVARTAADGLLVRADALTVVPLAPGAGPATSSPACLAASAAGAAHVSGGCLRFDSVGARCGAGSSAAGRGIAAACSARAAGRGAGAPVRHRA